MCGIFGIVTVGASNVDRHQLKKVINSLFTLSELRGKEATGLAIKSKISGEIGVLRKSVCATEFIKTKSYNKFFEQFINEKTVKSGISLIGHTRIATNGYVSTDNQPILKNNVFGVHNGIICNIDSLWSKYSFLERKQVIDTELLIGLINDKVTKSNGENIGKCLFDSFNELEGTASFGLLFSEFNDLVFGTNCGSLYFIKNDFIFAFASEKHILEQMWNDVFMSEGRIEITKMEPTTFGVIDEKNLSLRIINSTTNEKFDLKSADSALFCKDYSTEIPQKPFFNNYPENEIRSLLENNIEKINKIKRCTRCILPETHPFIHFDDKGICNYCNDFLKRRTKLKVNGSELLKEITSKWKLKNGNDCIVLLSGGRDSCYALHLVKKELGLNPIAYSYDWGMLTDLGRRNQARMCEKLGVEHVIVSADIKMKRRNIKLNVEAFLSNPHLGMIGLFMAGDKAYHHFADMLGRRFDLPLIGGSCPLEYTYFKEGFTNAKPSFMKRTFMDRMRIISFFGTQAIKNPAYLNASIFDNLLAFKYYFMEVLDVTNIFQYYPWDENEVNRTLVNEYNWELAVDTPTSWRIGDGTAAFYNYIYNTVAGFTENDCLRSNQINENVITREQGLKLALEENKPRYESLLWYCDTIGIDLKKAILDINRIPKLY